MGGKRDQQVRVRILDGNVLWHDDRAHYPGHQLDVTAADATALEEAGTAEPVHGRRKPKAKPDEDSADTPFTL